MTPQLAEDPCISGRVCRRECGGEKRQKSSANSKGMKKKASTGNAAVTVLALSMMRAKESEEERGREGERVSARAAARRFNRQGQQH